MKPDWSDAPYWANWLARDKDGWWIWYEAEPEIGEEQWLLNTNDGIYKLAAREEENSWTKSLEERP